MKPNSANPYQTARVYSGYTQEQAAERLHISTRTLQGYESGSQAPPLQMIAQMSALYEWELGMVDNPAAAMTFFSKQLKDVREMLGKMLDITHDGIIWPSEADEWHACKKELVELGASCYGLANVPVYDIPESLIDDKKRATRRAAT